MAKANQFYLAAETIVTTIEDQDIHQEAVTLLSKADRANAKYLKVLLDLKTRSGYSAILTSKTDQKRAGRAAAALVAAARASA
jgi:hypothetical protein